MLELSPYVPLIFFFLLRSKVEVDSTTIELGEDDHSSASIPINRTNVVFHSVLLTYGLYFENC